MTVTEMPRAAQYLVDADGNKQAVVLDWVVWEELLLLLEDLEDAEEMRYLQEIEEEEIPWEKAKAERPFVTLPHTAHTPCAPPSRRWSP